MPQQHTRWNTEALWQQLAPLLPGLSIEVVARVDSTNTQLLDRARMAGDARSAYGRRAGDTQPCMLVAEQQTGGRGRLGRPWKSEADASLTFSLSLPLRAADWSGLSLAVGIALSEALDPSADGAAPRLQLKWPNDLMLADPHANAGARKLGGILIESIAVGARRMAVIGIGLNIGWQDVGELPNGFAWLRELQPDADPPGTLAQVALPLVRTLLDFERAGFSPLVTRFAARDLLGGRRVELVPGGPVGIADGIAADGALRLVDDDGALHLVNSGEVSVRVVAR